MLTEYINAILPSLDHMHSWAYWIALFAALLETTIGIGLLFPGSSVILLLGALSARGNFDTGDLIWFAVAGAVLGDNLNYYLGRKYGGKWIEKGFWFLKTEHIEKASAFMDTNGAKSIFLGRFIPTAKELIPFIAGSVKMNRTKFMLWNLLGGIGWGIEWVLAGYIFARSLNLAELWISRAGLFFVFLVISFAILYLLKWLVIRKGKQFYLATASIYHSASEAIAGNEHTVRWIQNHPHLVSFVKERLDTSVFTGLPATLFSLVFVYLAALFAGIVEDFITSDLIVAADLRIANLMPAFRTEALTEIFTWITLLGKSEIIIIFICALIALLLIWRKRGCILPLLLSVVGSVLCTTAGKFAFHRPRPSLAVYFEPTFSFPSGHATIAVAFYGFAAYLLIRFVDKWKTKVNILFCAILLIGAIGGSRVYLGEHYISDVWSGFLVGAMWLTAAIAYAEWLRHKTGSRPTKPFRHARSGTFAILCTAIVFYNGFAMHYNPPPAPAPILKRIAVQDITDIFTREQLQYTETLLGTRQEPINLIFTAVNKERLTEVLGKAGWILSDKASIPSFYTALKALLENSTYPQAPISPSFYNGEIQRISFARIPGTNWLKDAQHLKIWQTHFTLPDGSLIFVGLANVNRGFKWGIMPKISPDLDTERNTLYQEISKTGAVETHRTIQLVQPLIGHNFTGDQFFTDGKAGILILKK